MKEALTKFYGTLYQTYGPHDPRSLSWIGQETQEARFRSLLEIGVEEGARILDYGCGFGDLYKFLQQHNLTEHVQYHGVDMMPEMIAAAQQRYGEELFDCWEVDTEIPETDYVLASGVFSLVVPNAPDVYYQRIRELFNVAKRGMAFNVLHRTYHPSDDTYLTYDPEEVRTFCQTLTPYVEMSTAHLYYDCTFYLRKQ